MMETTLNLLAAFGVLWAAVRLERLRYHRIANNKLITLLDNCDVYRDSGQNKNEQHFKDACSSHQQGQDKHQQGLNK